MHTPAIRGRFPRERRRFESKSENRSPTLFDSRVRDYEKKRERRHREYSQGRILYCIVFKIYYMRVGIHQR